MKTTAQHSENGPLSTKETLNRRGFLKSGALLASAAGVASTMAGTVQAATRDKVGWKTAVGLNGFQSGTHKYKKTYPIWEVMDYAHRTGFDGVELVGDWPQGGYPDVSEPQRVRALRRMYDLHNLKIFSIQLGADGAFDPDETRRRAWVQLTEKRIKLASALGCSCVGMWPGGGLRGQPFEAALQRLAESFREVAEIAGRLGIITAFEIEPPFVFNKAEHLLEIHARANHPNLKVIYDPSHFDLMNGSTGRPHELLLKLGVKNIGYVQLTDGDGTLRDGGTSKHLPCGDGHDNVPESLRILRRDGFKGWVMIDSWEVPDPYEACTKGISAIRAAWRDRL